MSKEVNESTEIDFSQMEHVSHEQITVSRTARGGTGALRFSAVNTPGNGKRAKLSKTLHERLGSPKTLQFAYDSKKNYLYIGETIPNATETVKFSSGKGFNIIYDAGFVCFLTDCFGLDFTERTSMSFSNVKVLEKDFEGEQIVFARIKMEAE